MTNLLALLVLAQPTPTINLSVDGEGYLRFANNGRIVYAKSATLVVGAEGKLIHRYGATLMPLMKAPASTVRLTVDLEGNLSAETKSGSTRLGRVVLALFASEPQLSKSGEYLTARTRPDLKSPGEALAGVIRSDHQSAAPKIDHPKPTASSTTQFSIPNEVTVTQDQVFLEDLIEPKPPISKIKLGPSPNAGMRITLTKERVLFMAKQSGWNLQSEDLKMSPSVTILRGGQSISQEELANEGLKLIRQKLGFEIQLSCTNQDPDLVVANGQKEYRLETLTSGTQGISAAVAVYVDGKRQNSRTLKYVGEALSQGVKSGAIVKVRFITNGYVAEISGRAKTSGFIGQTIEVSVAYDGPNSTTTHAATVVGMGVVEVKI